MSIRSTSSEHVPPAASPARVKGPMIWAVLAVPLGWLLVAYPSVIFLFAAWIDFTGCFFECGGATNPTAGVLFVLAIVLFLTGPVLIGCGIRRHWTPLWKIGAAFVAPALLFMVYLFLGGGF